MTKWQNNSFKDSIKPGSYKLYKIEVRPDEYGPYKRYYLLARAEHMGVNLLVDDLPEDNPYKQELLRAFSSPDIYCIIEGKDEFEADDEFGTALPAILYAGEWEPVVQDLTIEPKKETRNDG